MWIVATLLECQETELESQVAEGNMQVQNIIFHLYSTCCCTFIFAAGASRQKSSISKSPTCCAQDGAATASCPTGQGVPSAVLPPLGPACMGSEQMETLTDVQHFTSSLLVKRKICLGGNW